MIGNTYENQLLTSSEISAWESYYTYEINHCRVIFRDESEFIEGYSYT